VLLIFKRKIKYFCLEHSLLIIAIGLAYLSYFVLEHPDVWTHQDTYLKRLLGYYAAPYVIFFSLFFSFYQWFKYRRIEVNLSDKKVIFNDKLINISSVNEIYIKHISLTGTNEYTLYEVLPMEHRKLLKIPMFFVPSSKEIFDNELNEFCKRNKVKLVKSESCKKESDAK